MAEGKRRNSRGEGDAMSQIRIIKPDFFSDEDVFELTPIARLAFIGLWTVADREGRFKWRPRRLKIEILPYDDIDFSSVLNELEKSGFIYKADINGEAHGRISKWSRWQEIPLPPDWQKRRLAVFYRDNYTCIYCGIRVDAPHCDHVFPRSRGGSDEIENLATSCPRCNISKNDKTLEEWNR